ncbi:unnamed protein product [Urochloa humidicola]
MTSPALFLPRRMGSTSSLKPAEDNGIPQPALPPASNLPQVCGFKWSCDYHQLGFGGGTADRCIQFWNTTTSTHLSCVNAGSQCSKLFYPAMYRLFIYRNNGSQELY